MVVPRIWFHVQPTVSHYREPLIRRLRQSPNFALEMVGRHKNAESAASERIASASAETLRAVRPIEVISWGKFWWEKFQVSAVWRGGYDAFVLEGRIFTVSTWVAAVVGRLRRRRVLLWGHGWKRDERGVKRRLRLCFYWLVDGLLVYGDQAKELGVSYGVAPQKIQVVYNSLYAAEQLPSAPVTAERTKTRATLIYSSRLTTRHRLDLLAEALREWPGPSASPEVVVVGDGAERPRLESVFAAAGVSAQFLGAIYDENELAELYAAADIALSIGGAGLNVIQALGFGVPVLAEAGHRDSSPEIEAVLEGETGRYFAGGSADSLRQTLREMLEHPEELARMGNTGLTLVKNRYTAERHASAIDAALSHFLAR